MNCIKCGKEIKGKSEIQYWKERNYLCSRCWKEKERDFKKWESSEKKENIFKMRWKI